MNSFIHFLNNRIDKMFNCLDEESTQQINTISSPTNNDCQIKEIPHIHKVFKWSLQGGKRIRSSMVLDIIHSLNNDVDFNRQQYFIDAALCIEFIHCSSLIIDDLPCMDNDSVRRGKSSVHVKFGEASAQLAAISLLCDAFQCMQQGLDGIVNDNICTHRHADKLTAILTQLLSKKVGKNGASGGQYIEIVLNNLNKDNNKDNNFKETIRNNILYNKEKHTQLSIIKDYIDKKTGSFFEIAFVFGYLFGGGSEKKIDKIEILAKKFGILYQIVDDLEDYNSDKDKPGSINIVNECGYNIIQKLYKTEKQTFVKLMKKLKIWSDFFIDLINN